MPRRRTKSERKPADIVFGDAVRAARKKRGWTIEKLGDRLGTHDKYLGEVELGFHSATIATAKEIADALEVRLAELVADL